MIKPGNILRAFVTMVTLLVALGGCDRTEGPVERAGKQVDQASEKMGQEIENAGRNIQDAAQGNKK